MSTTYVGLDTGSRSCYYCMRDQTGETIQSSRIQTDNDCIRSCFEQMDGPVQVHLEASSLAGHIRYLLQEQERVEQVVVSDPAQNELIARDPRKGDPRDARVLSDLLRTGFFKEVWYPDDKRRWSFRQLVSHYDMFDCAQVAMKSWIGTVARVLRMRPTWRSCLRWGQTGTMPLPANTGQARSDPRMTPTRV